MICLNNKPNQKSYDIPDAEPCSPLSDDYCTGNEGGDETCENTGED